MRARSRLSGACPRALPQATVPPQTQRRGVPRRRVKCEAPCAYTHLFRRNEGIFQHACPGDDRIVADDRIEQLRALADRRTLPNDRTFQPRACFDAHAIVHDARTLDRDVLADSDAGAKPHRAFDARSVADCCRRIDAVGARLRDSDDAAYDVVARTAIFARRADVGPIRAARIESVEALACRLQRWKHLLAEVVELARRDVLEDPRREHVNAGVDEFAAFAAARRLLLKARDLPAFAENDDAVLFDVVAFDQRDAGQGVALAMEVDEPVEAQVGDFVAADYQEVFLAEER